jgi:hypothetical protein
MHHYDCCNISFVGNDADTAHAGYHTGLRGEPLVAVGYDEPARAVAEKWHTKGRRHAAALEEAKLA